MRSFVKEQSSEPVAAAETGGGVAVVQEAGSVVCDPKAYVPSSRALTSTRPQSSYVDGEIVKSDLKMPYLACVQSVGPRSVMFSAGVITLGETAITDAPKPKEPTPRLRILICDVQKRYLQNLPYNPAPDAPRPNILSTAQEVLASGGTLEYRGNIAPTYVPRATCLILVRCPATLDDPQFNVIEGDNVYAPALVSFQKTSYSAAKTLFTDLSLSLKGDPTATFYDLFWAREQKGANWVWVAKLVRVRDEQPSVGIKAIAQTLRGGTTTAAVEDDTEA